MKRLLIILLVVAVIIFGIQKIYSRSSSTKKTSVVSVTPAVISKPAASSPTNNLPLLALPFDKNNLPSSPKSFGLYPFGLKSSEHPEGHAGLNIETTATTNVTAPADMKITTLSSPAGRSDEHNVEADQVNGDLKFEYLRVGALSTGIQVGSVVKAGETLALPGKNHTLGVYMFHFGVLDAQKNAICPVQSFWQPTAWSELSALLKTSIGTNGQPYQAICVSTQPIPFSARRIE